jgi:hypothetical protein
VINVELTEEIRLSYANGSDFVNKVNKLVNVFFIFAYIYYRTGRLKKYFLLLSTGIYPGEITENQVL